MPNGNSVSEFLPESSVYTDYKWPVHFSLKQMDIPLVGYDKFSRMSLFDFDS